MPCQIAVDDHAAVEHGAAEAKNSTIRAAVLDLLAEHGPGRVTMEAVAAAARTSKPVLYRRWPDSASLLRDTLLRLATAAIPHEDTGSYRGDVRPDVPVEIARELGQSVLWHRLLVTGDPITDDLVVRLVDEVLVAFVASR